MANLKEAFEYAAQNPDSETARTLKRMAEDGVLDVEAKKFGIDLTPFKTQQATKDKSIVGKFLEETKRDLKESITSTQSTIDRQKLASSKGDSLLRSGETLLKAAGQTANFAGDVAFNALKLGSRVASKVIPDVIEDPVKELAKDTAKQLLDVGLVQDGLKYAAQGVEAYEEWKAKNPRKADALESVVNIASIIPVSRGTKLAGELGVKGVKSTTAALPAVASAGAKAVKSTANVAKAAGGQTRGVVGDTIKFITSQATGLSPSTIDTILKNPSEFAAKSMEKYSREGLGLQVKNALDKKITELGSTGKLYEAIKESGEVAESKKDWIVDWLKTNKYAKEGLTIKPTKLAKFSSSEKNAFKEFVDVWGKKAKLNGEEFLDGRDFLDQWAEFGKNSTDEGTAFFRKLYHSFNNEYRDKFKGLKELDADYGKKAQDLKLLKKDYLNTDGSLKDSALSKIANLDKKGRESVLQRLEAVEPGMGEKIRILSAVDDIALASGQKVGTYARYGLGAAGALSLQPQYIVAAILLEPKVASKILRTVGRTRGLAKDTINKILNKYNFK